MKGHRAAENREKYMGFKHDFKGFKSRHIGILVFRRKMYAFFCVEFW